jgi:hypothetical protein
MAEGHICIDVAIKYILHKKKFIIQYSQKKKKKKNTLFITKSEKKKKKTSFRVLALGPKLFRVSHGCSVEFRSLTAEGRTHQPPSGKSYIKPLIFFFFFFTYNDNKKHSCL